MRAPGAFVAGEAAAASLEQLLRAAILADVHAQSLTIRARRADETSGDAIAVDGLLASPTHDAGARLAHCKGTIVTVGCGRQA